MCPKHFRVGSGQQLLRHSSQAPEQEKHVEAPPCLLRVCGLNGSVASNCVKMGQDSIPAVTMRLEIEAMLRSVGFRVKLYE